MDVSDLDPDPIVAFHRWFEGVTDHAVTLATADANGTPSARIVLHKGADERGFTFFTNYDSRKGRELFANPRAALVYYWPPDRQVRVEGTVERVDEAESDEYWATRPRGSQLGAWASAQSEPIDDRSVLEARLAEVTARFDGADVPRPAHWGGFRVVPTRVELWCHRDDRLHDRVEYVRAPDGAGGVGGASGAGWTRRRLSP